MRIETMLVVLIGLVVLMSGVQAVQLGTLTQAISNGAVISSSSAAAAASAPKASVPNAGALSNLPRQVGGCG